MFVIDVTRLVGRLMKGRLPTGVDRVIVEYIRHYGSHARAAIHIRGQFKAISRAGSQILFGQMTTPTPNLKPQLVRCLARELCRPGYRSDLRDAFFLNVGHGNLHVERHQQTLRGYGMKPIYFIHDLIPITHPEYCRNGEAARHKQRISNALIYGAGLIVNSRATLAEVERFAEQQKLSVPPSAVALLGSSAPSSTSQERPMHEPYFVILGTIEARKNHWMLLQVWCQLVAELGNNAPKLVIIGQRGWECENVLALLERCKSLDGVVLEKSGCNDAEMARYLRHAQALLFPSFAEGFGMPMIEALQLGTPVIASDILAFREVARDIPHYLNPIDGIGWKHAVKDFCDSGNSLRQHQLKRIDAYQVPSWTQHFAVVNDFLNRLS